MHLSDFHNHLQNIGPEELSAVLVRAHAVGVTRFICNGTNPGDWEQVLALAREKDAVLPCLGIHPWFVSQNPHPEEEQTLRHLERCLDTAVTAGGFRVALGEVGLDGAMRPRNDERQELFLEKQLAMAAERGLPVMLHAVRSQERLLPLLRRYRPPVFLIHQFSGSAPLISELASLGAFFSLGGAIARLAAAVDNADNSAPPRRLLETVMHLPMDRLLLESDAPARLPQVLNIKGLLPCPEGGRRSEPALVAQLPSLLAKIRGISETSIKKQVMANEARFFEAWPRLGKP